MADDAPPISYAEALRAAAPTTDDTVDPAWWAGLDAEGRMRFLARAVERARAIIQEGGAREPLLRAMRLTVGRQAFRRLRATLEAGESRAVTWDEPGLVITHPVEWTWDEVGDLIVERGKPVGRAGWGGAVLVTLGEERAADAADAPTTVSDLASESILVEALTGATREVVRWREKALDPGDGSPTFIVPEALRGELDGLEGDERRHRMDDLAAPHYPLHEVGEDYPEDQAFPSVVDFTLGAGDAVRVFVHLAIHATTVDADARTAHVPVWASLDVLNGPPLADWTDEDRTHLWEKVDDLFDMRPALAEADRILNGAENALGLVGELRERVFTNLPDAGTATSPTRYLLDGQSTVDADAAAMLHQVEGLKLPRRWGAIRRWDDLVDEEVERLKAQHGAAAVRSKAYPDAPLVRRDTKSGPVLELSKDAEETLLATVGHKGYRRILKGEDGIPREYLVKRLAAGKGGAGFVEVRLSWYGTADRLVAEEVERSERETRAKRSRMDGNLFEDLDDRLRERLDDHLTNMRAVKHARKVMEYALGRLGCDGRNPIEVPAYDFRHLLGLETARDAMARIDGCLLALEELHFEVHSKAGAGRTGKAGGRFLRGWTYEGRGAGAHADGIYQLDISPAFVGCLAVFTTTSNRAKDETFQAFDWTKRLDVEERKRLERFHRMPSALLPHYDRVKGFTDHQVHALRFVSEELTRNRDYVPAHRKGARIAKGPGATDYREYDRDFCPLLPEGRTFYAALGHFRKNPEAGWTLSGARRHATSTGGHAPEGILHRLGYSPPPGAASARRLHMMGEAIGDLRAVVEDALGGLVVARLGTGKDARWLTVEEALELPERDLGRVRWVPFVADDWLDRLRADLAADARERHRRGDVDYLLEVTTDRGRYAESVAALRGQAKRAAGEGADVAPIHERLRKARAARGLTQAQAAAVFGVARETLSRWERTEKPVPDHLVEVIARWAETGEAPTEADLAPTKARSAASKAAAEAGGGGDGPAV